MEIVKVGEWMEDRWNWNLDWRRSLFAWEHDQWEEFSEIVFSASPLRRHEDK